MDQSARHSRLVALARTPSFLPHTVRRSAIVGPAGVLPDAYRAVEETMWSWFRRKTRSVSPERETVAGGSRASLDDGDGFPQTPTELLDGQTADFARQREQIYREFFGPPSDIFHEILPVVPQVDIYSFAPGHGERDFHTLVTSGMSDRVMDLPSDAADATSRVELILYCRQPDSMHLETLRRLAHFPHETRSWLAAGHTMPNGSPPEPIWGSPSLDTFLFLPTILAPDMNLPDQLKLGDRSVEFLWVVPISSAECDLKLGEGIDELLDLFDRFEHPHVFDPHRPCYVTAAR